MSHWVMVGLFALVFLSLLMHGRTDAGKSLDLVIRRWRMLQPACRLTFSGALAFLTTGRRSA